MKSNGIDRQSQTVTKQRIRAMKRTLSRQSPKAHLGDAIESRYGKRVSMEMAVWFVIGVRIFSSDAYRQIFRSLTPLGTPIPGISTLTEVRHRVGFELLEQHDLAVVRLLGTARKGVGFYKGMRLMVVDGFTLSLLDSNENRKEFGRPNNVNTHGPFPQARCVALCELGTHVVWRTAIGRSRDGEQTLFKKLFRFLSKGMLVLMDRNFLSWGIASEIFEQQGPFFVRCKSDRILPVLRRLKDGSYLSRIYATQYDQHKDRNGIDGVIEYTLDDPHRVGCDPRRV